MNNRRRESRPDSGQFQKSKHMPKIIALIAVMIFIMVFLVIVADSPKFESMNLRFASVAAVEEFSEPEIAPMTIAVQTFIPSETPAPTPEPEPEEVELPSFKAGDRAQKIGEIQLRLMALNFMDNDEPTTEFTETTREALLNFQKKNNITPSAIADNATLSKLFDEKTPAYVIGVGDDGTMVTELSSRLVDLEFLRTPTSEFGGDVALAVRRFQAVNSLSATGTVDFSTKEKLYSEEAVSLALKLGSTGDLVELYQSRLNELGYFVTDPPGEFIASTANAVKRFQEKNGLITDGALGLATIDALMGTEAEPNVLSVGSRDEYVKLLQERLIAMNYYSGAADGYFNTKTAAALKKFQSINALEATGKLDSATAIALLIDPKSAPKTPTPTKTVTKTTPKPVFTGTPGPAPSIPEVNGATVEAMITMAKSRLGCRYVLGAKGPAQFDCSGLVYWVINQVGIKQAYMTSATWQKVTKYPKIEKMEDLRAGDIISFKGHVGICIGGGQMVDASSANGKVVQRTYNTAYWKGVFVAGFRVL